MDNGASSYRRFLDGDDNGLVELIKDYKDGLVLYLCGFTDNILSAEDAMEETFVRLAVKKPKFSGKSSFKSWLYAIGRNAAIDHMRRKNKRRHENIEDYSALAAEEEELEKVFLVEERKIKLHTAMKALKSEHRQVLWLVYFEDFSISQASEAMGRSKHATENLLYRARLSLKAKLEKEGFVYEEL
ncbi:MAG: RNA polymerase sigma factor [Clostridia bacterium]|nr:RNA polymerase sigma factor [Clostridia bacterium]